MENAATMPDAPDLPDDPAALKALVIAGRIEKADLAEEVARLRAIVAAFQRAAFGRRSETLDPDQLQLDLERALEEASQEIAENRADEDAADATRKASRAERRRVNRGALPAHLPRVEIVVEPDETACPCCGGALHVIGEDRAERLDVIPAQYRVLITRRPKYACRACSDGVVQAPEPARLIPGGLPTEALVAAVLTAKYADHMPLHRQAQAMARQGLSIDRSTLGDWVGCAARELRPVHARLVEILKASPKLFADETTAPVLDPGHGRTKTGWLWALARDDRPWGGADPPAAAFLYAEGRGAEDAARHLSGFSGVLQVDGYAAYRSLADPRRPGGPATLALCWSHLWMPPLLQGVYSRSRRRPRLRSSIRPVMATRPAPPASMVNPRTGSQSRDTSSRLDATNGFIRLRYARFRHHAQFTLASAAALTGTMGSGGDQAMRRSGAP
jgi:transposase